MEELKWSGYINKQYYSECQVVSAINALYFYTGKTIKPKSKKYEKLVDEFKCRDDGASRIESLYKRFGLIRRKYSRFPKRFVGVYPIETGIIHKEYHSCLIIARDGKKLRITNIPRHTDDGWYLEKNFKKKRPRFPDNFYYVIKMREKK